MWRILEGKGKRDCKGFALISDFSFQSCEPQSFPRDMTIHHCCQRDCSRYYLSFPPAREFVITGRTLLLEQTWFQDTPKDCSGHWVTWLNTGLQIKGSQILMVAWSKTNINELIRRWEVKSSQESICWVGGNKGNVVCKKRRKEQKK